MTTPYAKLLLQRNGGALESGNVVAAHSDVVQLRAESKVGWGYPVALWELYDFPDGYTLPAGWTLHATTGAYYYSGNEDPPSFTLPASTTLWGKFMPRLYILGGTQSTYRDSSTGIKILSPAGLHDVARYETDQFGGYVNEIQKDLRILESIGGGAYVVTAVKTTTYTAAIGELVRCNASGAGFTVNMPTAVGNAGKGITIKKTTSTANVVTVDGNGSETIDGAATYAISANLGILTVVSDGTNWMAFPPV